MEWISVNDRLPKLGHMEIAGKPCIVAYLGYKNKLQVTSMTYQRTKVRNKTVERWEWHDRIAANVIGEPLYWMPFPEPPQN